MSRMLNNNVLPVVAIIPQNDDGNAVSGADTTRDLNYEEGVILCAVGLVTGTPTSFSVIFKVQHKDVGGSYADVGDTVTIIAGSSVAKLDVDMKALKAVFKVVATVAFVAGTTPALDLSAVTLYGEHKSV